MKLCRKCNVYYNNEELSFCPACGTTLEESNICPNCNTINEPEFVFCSNCGASLKANTPGNNTNKNAIHGSSTITQPNDVPKNNSSKLKYYVGGLVFVLLSILALNYNNIKLYINYNDATSEFNKKNYAVAAEKFKVLGYYKDSKDMYNESLYQDANDKYDKKEFVKAEEIYRFLSNYKDSHVV